jgi:hypothetical protein
MSSGFSVEPGELTGLAGTLGAAADVLTGAAPGLTGIGDLGLPDLTATAESFGNGWQELVGRLAGIASQLSDAISAASRQYDDIDATAGTAFDELIGADR